MQTTTLEFKRQIFSTAALWVVLAFVIQFSHKRIVEVMGSSGKLASEQALVIPRARVAKLTSLGYDQLVADCWWLAFIQYYGDTRARLKDHYQQSYKYLDLITKLDPKFTQPYWFAAFAVGSEQKRPDLAAQVLDRGVQANQDSWYLPYIAGINQYLFAHNDQNAARYYRRAAKYPGAPDWLLREATVLEQNIPTLYKQLNTWDTIYSSATDPLVKQTARQNLIAILWKVYRLPVEAARRRAGNALKALGVEIR